MKRGKNADQVMAEIHELKDEIEYLTVQQKFCGEYEYPSITARKQKAERKLRQLYNIKEF